MNEASLSVYSFEARVGYQILIWPVVVVGLIGNVLVLWRAGFGAGINSPLKPMYRGALVSLAISDLLLLVSSGYNVLANLTRSVITWSLPDWACSLLPCVQTTAALSTSLTLAAVAADRYRAIKPIYPPPTGPRWPMAFFIIIVTWCISIAATYPIYELYSLQSLIVVTNTSYYRAALCVTSDREKTTMVYTALYVVIFLPLAIVFLSIHGLLALQIRARQRRANGSHFVASNDSQFAETSTASTSGTITSPVTLRRVVSTTPLVPRKKRTVKIILLLIGIFLVCRLPMWTFALVKLYVTLSGGIWWHVQACVTILSLFNAAVNPFLYTFLNETLSIFTWIRSWCSRTNEGNLTTDNPEKPNKRVASIKVPRGPYSP